MKTKLYRSRTDSMVGGVCGGLGQYLGIDPVLIRLFLVLLTIGGGSGVLLYLVLWIVIPLEGEEGATTITLSTGTDEMAARAQQLGSELGTAVRSPHPQAALLIGVSLLVVGVIYLLRNLGLPWIGWLDLSTLWPLLLIGGGVALILRRGQGAAL
jgi:phage shock protein C